MKTAHVFKCKNNPKLGRITNLFARKVRIVKDTEIPCEIAKNGISHNDQQVINIFWCL
jgi:hypothetical protein